ncbi:protein serine/threonine kinase [Entamoeba marina]
MFNHFLLLLVFTLFSFAHSLPNTPDYVVNGLLPCEDLETLQNGTCVSSLSKSELKSVTCPSDCITCDDSSQCLKCNESYYLSNYTSCDSVANNCAECNKYECTTCLSGYYLIAGNCKTCPEISNCETCSVDGCIECDTGYYLENGACNSCNYYSSYCTSCNSNECLECSPEYYLSDGKCEVCSNVWDNCVECSSTECLTCESNISTLVKGSCYDCNYRWDNCLTCSDSECTQCDKGYFVSGECYTGCDECSGVEDCNSCSVGYYLSLYQWCDPCSEFNCFSCSLVGEQVYCDSCLDGYLYDNNGNCSNCQDVLENCTLCSGTITNAICLECLTGSYLGSDYKCHSCNGCGDEGCVNDELGYYPSTSCNDCSKIPGCESCSNILSINSVTEKNCLVCGNGFKLEDGTCKLLTNCIEANGNECVLCQSQYILVDGECLHHSTQLGCLSSSNNYCDECDVGYGLYVNDNNENYECKLCPTHCSECSVSNFCTLCDSNYRLNYTGSSYSTYGCIECDIDDCLKCNGTYCGECNESFFVNDTGLCQSCSYYDEHCLICSEQSSCTSCELGYYAAGNSCLPCSNIPGCMTCLQTDGVCTDCADGYLLTKESCDTCDSYFPNCMSCSYSSCEKCNENYFLENGVCKQCSEIQGCKSCSQTNRTCFNCYKSYALVETDGVYECIECSELIPNCYDCDGDSVCSECEEGYTVSNDGCVECNEILSNCTSCSTSTEYCYTCANNNYYVSDGVCVSCLTKTLGACELCTSSTYCTKCSEGYYLQDTSCKSCTEIENCLSCNSLTGVCTLCATGFYPSDGVCVNCSNVNCLDCKQDGSGCVTCQSGYYLSNSECVGCESFDKNCVSCEGLDTCSVCQDSFYPQDGICVDCSLITNCVSCEPDSKNCTLCADTFVVSDGVCCTECDDSSFTLIDGKCESCTRNFLNCKECDPTQYLCKECDDGFYYAKETCYLCNETISNCDSCSYDDASGVICSECSLNSYLQNNECIDVLETQYKMNHYSVDLCSNAISNCFSCQYPSTTYAESFDSSQLVCLSCMPDYYMKPSSKSSCYSCPTVVIDGECITCIDGCKKCVNTTEEGCIEPSSYKTVLRNGKMVQYQNSEMCLSFSKTVGCEKNCIVEVEGRCVTCDNGYSLDETNNPPICIECGTGCSECNNNDTCLSCKDGLIYNTTGSCFKDVNCITIVNSSCVVCEDGYRIVDGTCEECIDGCKNCQTSGGVEICNLCSVNYVLIDNACQLFNETNCSKVDSGSKCITCKSGFYLSGNGDCLSISTENCQYIIDNACYVCEIDTKFGLSSEGSIDCEYDNTLSHCIALNETGCSRCESGYFVYDSFCKPCSYECKMCLGSESRCISCNFGYTLNETTSSCEYIGNLAEKCKKFLPSADGCAVCNDDHCTEYDEEERICGKCEFGYSVSEDGIVGIPIIAVFLLCLVVVIIIGILILFISSRIHSNKKEKVVKNKIVDWELQGIIFDKSGGEDGIILDKNNIEMFESIDDPLIPVNKECTTSLVVGNTKKGLLKVQISTKDHNDKYDLRIEPQLVTIKKGYAVEIFVHVTPLCTCTINDTLSLIAINLRKGKQITKELPLIFSTPISTRIDYDELVIEKQIGEGGFGIVYKGIFRGYTVAIKKMKNANEEQLEEFEKEVAMLDKFRSDYIVHFYGAVFIPNKICMVTEFAQYGSLQDLMKKRFDDPIEENMKLKIISDAAKGLQYLHSNNILHRDIKPDNILVTSLDNNIDINGKLTDFGASRNVNLLFHDMTLTKYVGSPAYMAPEVLKRDKYFIKADIYSFGVTLYETIQWSIIYKGICTYRWDIAKYVTSGKRLPQLENMSDEIYDLISNCWSQEPQDRYDIEDVVVKLDATLNKGSKKFKPDSVDQKTNSIKSHTSSGTNETNTSKSNSSSGTNETSTSKDISDDGIDKQVILSD